MLPVLFQLCFVGQAVCGRVGVRWAVLVWAVAALVTSARLRSKVVAGKGPNVFFLMNRKVPEP